MYTTIICLHSILRYLILILMLAAIAKSFSGWMNKKKFTEAARKLNLFTLIFAHIQLLVGLGVYFTSAEVQFSDLSHQTKEVRFFTIEHIAMMVIAIALITIGYTLSKKGKTDEAKYKRAAIFFLLALLIIFYAIPWPWSAVARGWLPGI